MFVLPKGLSFLVGFTHFFTPLFSFPSALLDLFAHNVKLCSTPPLRVLPFGNWNFKQKNKPRGLKRSLIYPNYSLCLVACNAIATPIFNRIWPQPTPIPKTGASISPLPQICQQAAFKYCLRHFQCEHFPKILLRPSHYFLQPRHRRVDRSEGHWAPICKIHLQGIPLRCGTSDRPTA